MAAARARGLHGASHRDVWNRDAALLSDAVDDPGRRVEEPRPVSLLPERGRDGLADRLPGITVGNELFEVVADFDADLAIVLCDDDEEAVVLAFVADPSSAVLEHLHGVLVDAAVRLESGHGRN